MTEKHEGDIPENNKNQKSFSKPDEPLKDWYDRVYGGKKKDKGSKDSNKDTEFEQAQKETKEFKGKKKEGKGAKRIDAEVWRDLKNQIDAQIENLSELSSTGKIFSIDLYKETINPSLDLRGIPEYLKGPAIERYKNLAEKLLKIKSIPKEPGEQIKKLRENLQFLRTLRLNPDTLGNNLLWNETISMIPHLHPEAQREFKARLEVFRFSLGFNDADGVKSGVAGASRVHMSHIGQTLKVPEIQKAYDLLEESAQITEEDIKGKHYNYIEDFKKKNDIKDDKDNKVKSLVKEILTKENPLYAGTGAQKKEVLKGIALKLVEVSGEKTEGLNNKEKEDLAEKYMWAVEEAEDVWRITFRSDESDIGMEGKGGQWYLNRLFHYGARLKSKGFGYESTRKYFNRPLLPIWIEGGSVLPILTKKGELQIKSEDIEKIRQRLKFKGLSPEKIEKRIEEIKGMSLEGRGLMMKGLWQYQIDFLKIDGLEKLKFNQEGGIKYTKDGNGRELPYVVYKRKFTSPNGGQKEMIVRIGVLEKNKYAVKEKDRYDYSSVLDIENPSAKILSEICEQVPEGFYGSYVGDWIFKAENTRELLEGGILKFPLGSEDDMKRVLAELQSKKLFDHLDPLAKDKGERKPGKYYREDAYEDLIRGSIDFGLHEGKKMFEPWKMWGAWRAGVLTKLATDLKVITDEQGRKIENDMLPFLGMRGNIPRWLRCNLDRYTMVFRWGPMRMMMLGEMLKKFFEGIFQGPPFAPSK